MLIIITEKRNIFILLIFNDARGACGIGFEQRMKEINKSKKERVHQELVSLIQMN